MQGSHGQEGQMEERGMKVYKGRGAYKEAPPQILLQDKWLERAGFNVGDKITVDYQQGWLIITKDEPKADVGTR